MSTPTEIEAALARLAPAEWMEVRRWMDAHAPDAAISQSVEKPNWEMPDFLARQQAIFGDRVLPDSQAILDELRDERF